MSIKLISSLLFCGMGGTHDITMGVLLLEKVKMVEMFLAAAYTLLSVALTFIKFIKQIDKIKTKTA